MPEIFRLNLPLAKLLPVSNNLAGEARTQPGEALTYTSEQRQQPSQGGESFAHQQQYPVPSYGQLSGQFGQSENISQNAETYDTSSMINSASLLDLAQTFDDTSYIAEYSNLTFPSNLEGFHVDLERAGDIWDLDWGDALL